MSGRVPDTTKAWNFIDHFRGEGVKWTSLPEHFKKNGYWTVGSGKLFHPNLPPNEDNPYSWSEEEVDPAKWPGTAMTGCSCECFVNKTYQEPDASIIGCSHCILEDDVRCPDVLIQENVSSMIQQAAADPENKQPFFIAMGIHKPHLPWAVPRRFWERMAAVEDIPIADNTFPPEGMPMIAWHLPTWKGFPYAMSIDQPVARAIAQKSRRAYYSAVSFADDLIGQTLETLRATDLAKETVVVVTADHGWQLGEHNEWCKQTLFDATLRVPFMIRSPGVAPKRTQSFAELVDLYKTLSDLAGLPNPEKGVQGDSLAPVVTGEDVSGKNAAFSQMARCFKSYHKHDVKCNRPHDDFDSSSGKDNCAQVPRQCIEYMGYTVRTKEWRLTEWVSWNGALLQPNFGAVNATELYEHSGPDFENFGAWENKNVADEPGNVNAVVALRQLLRARFDPSASIQSLI